MGWKNIDAWSTAGAAKAITTSFVAGNWFTISDGNAVVFDVLMASSAAPASIEMQLEISPDGGTTALGPVDTCNLVAGGVAYVNDEVVYSTSTADGHHCITMRGLIQGMSYRLGLRCTGGTTPTALIKAYIGTL